MASNYYDKTFIQDLIQSGLYDRDTEEESSDNVDTLSERIDESVSITHKQYKKLEKQQAFIKNNLNFVFSIDDDLHNYQKWCFENDLIFMVKEVRLLGDEYQALVFKNMEDAMAFKLKWL